MAVIQLAVTDEQKKTLEKYAKEIAHSSTLAGWAKMILFKEADRGLMLHNESRNTNAY